MKLLTHAHDVPVCLHVPPTVGLPRRFGAGGLLSRPGMTDEQTFQEKLDHMTMAELEGSLMAVEMFSAIYPPDAKAAIRSAILRKMKSEGRK